MRRLFLFLSIVLFFSSCKKDEKGDLVLRFNLKYGDKELKMFEDYNYPQSGEVLNFTKVAFYISDIKAQKGTSAVILKDIDYIDLTASHTAPTGTGSFEYRIKDVEAANYRALLFGIGVPAASNSKEPKDFPSSSALSNTSEYWTAWKSYIFMRNEGRIDLDNDGSMESPFALHLGGDQAYIPVGINRSFTITANQTTFFDLIIDMEKLFNGTSLYNIHETRQIHSLSQMPAILQLIENIKTGIQ